MRLKCESYQEVYFPDKSLVDKLGLFQMDKTLLLFHTGMIRLGGGFSINYLLANKENSLSFVLMLKL